MIIPYADPNEVKEELEKPDNRKLLACCRLLINRSDSLVSATVFNLSHAIGESVLDRIYYKAAHNGLQFGAALLTVYEDDFVDPPNASRGKAIELVGSILTWLDDTVLLVERPEEGWGRWMVSLGGNGTIPEVTA